MNPDDDLADFADRLIEYGGDTHTVYMTRNGPAVLVLPEMPGITSHVARFARWVRELGLSAWVPSLFGRDGAAPTMDLTIESMRSGCVRREFDAFAAGSPSPMTAWLRHLAGVAHSGVDPRSPCCTSVVPSRPKRQEAPPGSSGKGL